MLLLSAPALAQNSLATLRQPATLPVSDQAVKGVVSSQPSSQPVRGEFVFGSYGRMSVYTNQLGKEVPDVGAVSRPLRLEKKSYLELYFGYHKAFDFGDFVALITPAMAGDPFHYTGQFRADFALRNAYVDLSRLGGTGFFAWAGSRMYRGDDVLLLDFWPLDDLNTLGGGFGYRYKGFEIAAHGGASRVIGTNFFAQQIAVADETFGSTTVVTNNRQRLIGSLKASHYQPVGSWLAFKLKFYLEAQSIASGAIQRGGEVLERLPGDSGYVVGGQLSLFQQNTRNYWHFFLRHGAGLGAYGSLSVPVGLNTAGTAQGASETLAATSFNAYFKDRVGVILGAYYRSFTSARNDEFDAYSTEEMIGALRVNVSILRWLQQGIEISGQQTLPKRINEQVLRQINPAVFKLSVMPSIVSGPENFPELALRLVYTYATQNPDARYLYVAEDLRASTRAYHFFGIQAEWLFELRL
jgi:LamB porin